MKASILSAATAAISRRLVPNQEPPAARESRLAAAAELAAWIALAIARIVFEILNAIVGVILAPVAWVADRLGMRGGGRPLTATEFAEAVVDAPPPPPRAPVPVRPATPLADLVYAHVRYREYWDRGMREPTPLPPDVKAWLDSMTGEQRKMALCVDKLRLEKHIAAGRAGDPAWGPLDLRPLKPLPLVVPSSYAGANGKAGGKGSMRAEPASAELAAVLAEHAIDLDYGYAAGGRR